MRLLQVNAGLRPDDPSDGLLAVPYGRRASMGPSGRQRQGGLFPLLVARTPLHQQLLQP